MIKNTITKTIVLPEGRKITIETGKLAKQADGSVVVKMGDTMLLATVVAQQKNETTPDFIPLYVDYQEKFAAAGKIPGSFLRREGRSGDHEILIARLIDRAIRPLFSVGYNAEIQINIFLISADSEILPDALVALAASAALMVSSIPFQGPIAGVRVARVAGQFLINPTKLELEATDIDLIVAASEQSIIMVEGEMHEVQEEEMLAAIKFAHKAIIQQCQVQKELAIAVGMAEKSKLVANAPEDVELREDMFNKLYDRVYEVAKQGIKNKQQLREILKNIQQNYTENITTTSEREIDPILINKYFQEINKEVLRNLALHEGVRIDGRKLDEIRSIDSEINYLPAAHGSCLFTRGETQSLTTVTLGTKLDEQLIDRVMTNGYNRFMLHYNFPGFATGEIKASRGPSRREIGHGNLAMRALKKVLPLDKENPYTIRIVSDILESNGSSSMATVCAGSLALMDAGVPIQAAVAGIAMGLVIDPTNGQYAILSDILGDEDALGDMDFKIAGTEAGITACQMDIKFIGLSYQILQEALAQSRAGQLHILATMNNAIDKPRSGYKPHVPRFSIMNIPRDMIGAVIGPGGKVVQEIQRTTKATIILEEVDDKGVIKFFAPDQDSIQQAQQKVQAIVAEPIIGETYQGKIKSVLTFGAFLEFLPGKDGFLHISEVKHERIENLSQVLKIGENIQVKLIAIDEKTGKYRLSRKVLLPKPNENSTG